MAVSKPVAIFLLLALALFTNVVEGRKLLKAHENRLSDKSTRAVEKFDLLKQWEKNAFAPDDFVRRKLMSLASDVQQEHRLSDKSTRAVEKFDLLKQWEENAFAHDDFMRRKLMSFVGDVKQFFSRPNAPKEPDHHVVHTDSQVLNWNGLAADPLAVTRW